MKLKDAYRWALEHHESTAIIVASGFLPFAASETIQAVTEGVAKEDAVCTAAKTLSPLLVLSAMRAASFILNAYTLNSPLQQKTRLKDYFKLRNLEKQLSITTRPKIELQKTKPVSLNIYDWWLELKHTVDYSKRDFLARFNEQKNPVYGLASASRSFHAGEFDQGLDELRSAIDVIQGKVQPSWSASCLLALYRSAGLLGRLLAPSDVRMYLFSAAYAALTNPQKAWYYSELGRMVADEFKSPFRKEMYVCHALLASAQGRSDEGEAWKDAIRIASEGAEWDRLGESRSVVRVIKNGTFFKNTFLFKQKESLDAILWERDCYETISDKVESVTVPKVLYCATKPENGTYTLAMRVLSGETLYDKLKKENYDAMPEVISALAEIHAKFPKEKLKPIGLEDRVKTGLRTMNLPAEIAQQITSNYTPVLAALNSSAWAWNKDAHPENWIIGEKIGAIDCESKNTAPVLCDVANLLEYEDFFTDEQKKKYIDSYVQRYNEKGGTIDFATALRDYHNAVIHRMICFASAWSDSTRPSLHSKRSFALRKGAKAIKLLKDADANWYSTHAQQYDALESSLLQSANLMDAYTS